MTEAEIQMQVVAMLRMCGRHDVEWHAVPNGEKRHIVTAARLKKLGVMPGVADIVFLIDRQSIALELKSEKGIVSKDQFAYQERFERAGGRYFVAFGLDQAIGVLNAIGVFRPGIRIANAFDGREVRKGERACKASRSPKLITAEA